LSTRRRLRLVAAGLIALPAAGPNSTRHRFDEIFEAGTIVITPADDSISSAGVHTVCVRAIRDNGVSLEGSGTTGPDCAEIIVIGPQGHVDQQGPPVSELSLFRSQMRVGQDNQVAAFADAGETGASNILSLQYRVGDGSWRAMDIARPNSLFTSAFAFLGPPDGAFPAALKVPGLTEVCVRAIDTAGNVGVPACVPLEIIL
jgi:hypothetical protein